MGVSTHVLAASAQNPNSELELSPSSCSRVCAMSATVWTRSLNSTKRTVQSEGSDGTESQIAATASIALLSCLRVTLCVRLVSAIRATASRNSRSASSTPDNTLRSTGDFSIISLQPLPSANRCPAILPLSTEETYFGSRG